MNALTAFLGALLASLWQWFQERGLSKKETVTDAPTDVHANADPDALRRDLGYGRVPDGEEGHRDR